MMKCSTLAGLLGLTALAGCAIPLGDAPRGPQPSQAAVAACKTRADQVFQQQNRDAIYKADRYASSIRDSPYAGQGLPGTSAGLSDQYDRAEDVRTCLNGEATPIEPGVSNTAVP